MCLFQYDDDPDPEEQDPAGSLYVPVRPGTSAMMARLFRTPLGARTAVGFTTQGRLTATLGAEQPWIRLSESTLRSLAAPLGAELLTVDPTLTAPAVTTPSTGSPVSRTGPATHGAGLGARTT
ncbi:MULTISPECIES: SAV_915 family protein [unclassified Streptomyces]|uniref:SAV_915 family protein n=1 Tax=unclassified Streptomyces TaxID=2593676 RepID=UPI00339E35E0